jgi:hypothetical protein
MAFDTAMALAAKFASQPPISAAMTKLSNNCLTRALDKLTRTSISLRSQL